MKQSLVYSFRNVYRQKGIYKTIFLTFGFISCIFSLTDIRSLAKDPKKKDKLKNPETILTVPMSLNACLQVLDENYDVMKELFGEFKPGDKVEVQEQEPQLAAPPETKKAKKKKKDPSEPKRPTTAFFYYTASIREEVKANNPGKTVGELSKIYGQMWADLSEEEKAPFQEKNEKDKERYAAEMEAWKNKA